MFLAINELLKEKSRFALIAAVIVLVGYLVFFLLALAYGLASSYTLAIDKWGADNIALNEGSNGNIGRSIITEEDYGDLLGEDGSATSSAAPLGVGAGTAKGEEPIDVSLFGVDTSSFVMPDTTDGRAMSSTQEVMISDELEFAGIGLGDSFKLQGDDTEYSVVGVVESASFQAAPVVYMSLADWRDAVSASSGMIGMRDDTSISAIVLEGSPQVGDSLEALSIKDFINTLPGYQAQVLTFSLMIGFLVGIAAFVLAIFIYILTIQKKGIFGVLKAEGVPNRYISSSVLIQVSILSIGGLAIGMGLALLTGWLLAGQVPFVVNPLFYAGISVLFVACAIIGALASVRSVTKIDPVEAIG